MTSSKTISGLLGPTLVALGLALLLNLGSMPAIAAQLAHDPALIFVSGILLFVAGIAILRVHNVWSGGWPVLVTVLGWLALIGGILRMFFPTRLAEVAAQFGANGALVGGFAIIMLVVGGFVSYKAYSRD